MNTFKAETLHLGASAVVMAVVELRSVMNGTMLKRLVNGRMQMAMMKTQNAGNALLTE